MKRETTNIIRQVLEDWVPPALRDSAVFRLSAEVIWGDHFRDLATFRARAPFLTSDEYAELYRRHPRVHDHSDNSEACIDQIINDVAGQSVCDIGCGTGYLLTRIRDRRRDIGQFTGVDMVLDTARLPHGIEFGSAQIESLPFADQSFDTVICTHVLEHILDLPRALAELRRLYRKHLLIVVPREREYRFTFNPHFHFFPYRESFLRAVHPIPPRFQCETIGRDIYYMESK